MGLEESLGSCELVVLAVPAHCWPSLPLASLQPGAVLGPTNTTGQLLG